MSFAERRGISLAQVLCEYTAAELTYWQAWEKHEISQEAKLEHVMAQLTCAYLNCHRKKNSKAHEMKDIVFRADWLPNDQARDSQTLINEFVRAFK
jgi:hypothetical protein